MLARPEIGTMEHILSWLTTKNEAETYEWLSGECPAGQYSEEFGDRHAGLNLNLLNNLARLHPHTWGALYQRASKA